MSQPPAVRRAIGNVALAPQVLDDRTRIERDQAGATIDPHIGTRVMQLTAHVVRCKGHAHLAVANRLRPELEEARRSQSRLNQSKIDGIFGTAKKLITASLISIREVLPDMAVEDCSRGGKKTIRQHRGHFAGKFHSHFDLAFSGNPGAWITVVDELRGLAAQVALERDESRIVVVAASKIELFCAGCFGILDRTPEKKGHTAEVVMRGVRTPILVDGNPVVGQREDARNGNFPFHGDANQRVFAHEFKDISKPANRLRR